MIASESHTVMSPSTSAGTLPDVRDVEDALLVVRRRYRAG